ncbi:hypothetical protein D1007_23093 [Hordeum vulgare]|nr:hypothetical protein D1007_23093 [Hordeum vulgare]
MPTATSSSSPEQSQPLTFVDHGGLAATIALPPEVVGQVAFVGVEVDVVGDLTSIFYCDDMLARIDKAVFVKKLCYLLASLDAASRGSAKTVACLLAKEVSMGKIKKMKKAPTSIGKKSGVIAKVSAPA